MEKIIVILAVCLIAISCYKVEIPESVKGAIAFYENDQQETRDGERAIKVLKKLFAKGIFATTDSGGTPLMFAASFGYAEIVSALITAGVDVNVKNNEGDTALIGATQEGHFEIKYRLKVAGAR